MIRVFVQARMSSSRFPGKVLAPFHGRPVIAHVVSKISKVTPVSQIVVATSTHESDDPLVGYLHQRGISVFRGPLENVFRRFQLCLNDYPCDWFIRVSADSPLLDPDVILRMQSFSERIDLDIVTNVFPRTFPKGHSVEMLNAARFAKLDGNRLTPNQREHVTKFLYDNSEKFEILNIAVKGPSQAHINLCIDTVEDMNRLQESEKYEDSEANPLPLC